MEKYISTLLDEERFIPEFILNIYLVATSVRYACLLEYANVFNIITIEKFYYKINLLLDRLNTKFNTNLIVMEETLEPYPRLLICKQENYLKIFKKLRPETKNYDYYLGNVLEMIYPGGNYYDHTLPRLIGHINLDFDTNIINIFSETFVINNYKEDLYSLEYYLGEKVKKFNQVLEKIELQCYYKIIKNDGTNIRLNKLEEKDDNYIIENINFYENDIFNDFKYTDEQKNYINSFRMM
jgi:hypothetical protein